MNEIRHGPGRPKKFGERPAHAVTLTLPEDVLEHLAAIDEDLGRAIVRLAERRIRLVPPRARAAEIARYGNRAVIVVTPVKALKRLPGIELVPTGNGRALIALEHPHSIPGLELAIRDALERGEVTPRERAVLESLSGILRDARQSRSLTVEERTIIVLRPKRPRRASPAGR